MPLSINKENIIELVPLQNILGEVTILSDKKPLDAYELIGKVKEHIPENYGSKAFYQPAYFNTRSTDFDSVILDIDYVGDFYFIDKKNVKQV